eukprot:gnl/MRDRNA2_/MRDRNA2_118315_c0_seq1.p2 gnl/MRDRNA2_/MRDRNA2_118315_c0~~gnl/MRDRNA2_/MRDRNA2_118315_c0_seq1.p2  ORF type:complete len:108 (+),score=34.77 gnl/MRDRNA2_/MRDRNA2_118315_c0_seq1:66-389(+)
MTSLRSLVCMAVFASALGSLEETVKKATEDMVANPYFMWGDHYDKNQALVSNGMDWEDDGLHWPTTDELVLMEKQAVVEKVGAGFDEADSELEKEEQKEYASSMLQH